MRKKVLPPAPLSKNLISLIWLDMAENEVKKTEEPVAEKLLTVSTSPHVKSPDSVQRIMYDVVFALIPAGLASVYFFGVYALILILLSSAAALATEFLIQKLTGRKAAWMDGSALITGILVAYNVPPGVPWWIPVIGSIFAIAIAKHAYGGLGYNPFNPALAGRVFLLMSWPVYMTTTWVFPEGYLADAVTRATPLGLLKSAAAAPEALEALNKISTMDLFIGRIGGSLGETSALLLLLGAAYLFYRKVLDWRIPVGFIMTAVLMALIFDSSHIIFHLLSGGMILGAFFMATDMVTSPVTPNGRLLFGVGCGFITMVVRLWGGYPEGASFAILLMNAVTPVLDRYTRPRKFGKVEAK